MRCINLINIDVIRSRSFTVYTVSLFSRVDCVLDSYTSYMWHLMGNHRFAGYNTKIKTLTNTYSSYIMCKVDIKSSCNVYVTLDWYASFISYNWQWWETKSTVFHLLIETQLSITYDMFHLQDNHVKKPQLTCLHLLISRLSIYLFEYFQV